MCPPISVYGLFWIYFLIINSIIMISYIGGKARIGKWIVPFIPQDIETYVEGFSGMFWVFFNMDLSKFPNLKTVVYNDFNGLNANLFRCAKHHSRLWDEL